jgi:hypothetical protein
MVESYCEHSDELIMNILNFILIRTGDLILLGHSYHERCTEMVLCKDDKTRSAYRLLLEKSSG